MSHVSTPAVRPAPRVLSAAAGLLALAGGLAGCGQRPADGYFPLESGHRWAYEVRSEWENATSDKELIVLTSLGEESLPEGMGGGKAFHRRSETGVDYWLRRDDSGIFRVASKTDLEADPNADKPLRPVLKTPLVVGTTWQASTTSYLLRRNNEFPPEIRHTHKPVPMTYRIEAVGEKVSTRAGAFSDCLRVQGTAAMRLFADPVVGFKDMPLVTTEWYCKGVGLVKVERLEATNNSTFLNGGKLVMELTEWQ